MSWETIVEKEVKQSGWEYIPGEEIFTASRIAAFQRAYSEEMGLPMDAIIVTPYGHQPIAVLPPADNEGRGKLPSSLKVDWARHPMFWLDPETRYRYPDEDIWTWAIRIDLELTARNLYNINNGMCIDALKYFCQMDLDNPVDRLRVENYRDGKYDQLLADFYIQRDPRLPFTEARQMAFAASKALHEAYIEQQEFDKEGVMLQLEAEVAFIAHAPVIFEKGVQEFSAIGEKMRVAAATHQEEIIVPQKKILSDHIELMSRYLMDLESHAASLSFVIVLHTETWLYQQHVEKTLLATKTQEDQRRVVIEDMLGVLYQDLRNEAHYINILETFKRWFVNIYEPATQTTEQINSLWEKKKLFQNHVMFHEPNISKIKLGKELWNVPKSSNDLSGD